MLDVLDRNNVPRHIAIIMDGNGRWAAERGKPRSFGHQAGVDTVRRITSECTRLGVRYLTLYTFSTENWNRPKDEVDALMKLLHNYMKTCLKTAAKNNMRVRVLGDKMGLAPDIRKRIAAYGGQYGDDHGRGSELFGALGDNTRCKKHCRACGGKGSFARRH